MADDRFASVADALLRIQSARSLEEAVRIAQDAAQRSAQSTGGFDGDAPFRYLFDQNPTPMWVYELGSLAFLEVNQAAIQSYGYTRGEFLGMRITDIRPSEDVQKLLDLTANRPPGLRYVGKWRHRIKSGVLIEVDISSATIEFGGRPAVLVVARDITQQAQIEARLREVERTVPGADPECAVRHLCEGHRRALRLLQSRIRARLRYRNRSLLRQDDPRRLRVPTLPHRRRDGSQGGRRPASRWSGKCACRPNVEYEWAMLVKFPIRDEDGNVIGIGGFDIDTDQAEARGARARKQRGAAPGD